MASDKPNIVFFHVDNLGMGELGCYGGGILRGADTKRMDTFAKEGAKLTHYVVEPQCTPTRSALMTGRFPIRSGNHTIALGGNAGGLVRWEKTIAEILSGAGYTSSCLGKWHIGADDGRWPTDHGFDEWYGPLRTYDECMWLDDPHYVPDRDGYSYMHEGKKSLSPNSPYLSTENAYSNYLNILTYFEVTLIKHHLEKYKNQHSALHFY